MCAQVGVFVTSSEVPAASVSPFDTGNAFIIGLTDSGPAGKSVQVTSLAGFASSFGTPTGSGNPYNSRTTTNAVMFDAVDAFFREGGQTAYVSRVTHGTPVAATIALAPSTALTLTAVYPGVGGNGIFVAVVNNSTTYTLTLQDSAGNVLATSPALSTLAAGVAWAATTGLVTAVSSGSTLPSTAAATAMSGGTDNRGSATIADWQTALTAFGLGLGPGQVFAPGQTNTGLSGIWSALGLHAQAYNRVALCDMDDNTSASSEVTAFATFGTSGVASYCGFWAGNRNIPGVVPGTTRSISPSAVIAALCARVDATGNPNQAAAGSSYPLQYCTGPTSLVSGTFDTYSSADLFTLNGAGINTFATRFGVLENYGFVAAIPTTTDAIYWQFNHARLRMALQAEAQVIGEPFVFSQIDGLGATAIRFGSAVSDMLAAYYKAGALFGATAADAFTVDVGSQVNTTASIAAGQLNAAVNVRMSPFAQQVSLVLNAVPTTQTV